ncbi:hypothetical protein [Ascidiimonas aurantiaca]|uniref:hypothetical protein n=1 Tax=Ascidiimonas aurantiaca TaxID=1685432 RepID=UPI0030EBA777
MKTYIKKKKLSISKQTILSLQGGIDHSGASKEDSCLCASEGPPCKSGFTLCEETNIPV